MREATRTRNGRKRATPPAETPSESVWYLRAVSYTEYRQSIRWRRRREEFRAETADVCGLCGLDDSGTDFTVRFHVHHITYERLGYELDSDLILLCAPCHNLIHYPQSPGAQHWVRFHSDTIPDLAGRAAELDPFA
jgi:hypothetical protein